MNVTEGLPLPTRRKNDFSSSELQLSVRSKLTAPNATKKDELISA
jgi:hypothetical protein